MTPREQVAYNAGIETMRQMALVAAATLVTREDGAGLRHQAAAAALHGLAEDAADLMLDTEDTRGTRTPETEACLRAFNLIAAEPGNSGTIECPLCAGRLNWIRDSLNGHLHGECETEGCLRWMQ